MHLGELIAFGAFVLFATWLDLYVLHKDDHDISIKEATLTSVAWVGVALLFSGYVFWQYGTDLWMQFLTGYTLEKALSVDNIFVIAMIFEAFKVRGGLQHRALAWGVVGAVIMRAVLILVGVELVERFNWLLPVFGAFLLFTGVKMLLAKDEEEAAVEDSVFYRWASKIMPIYPSFDRNKLITVQNGKRMLTLLGISIVMVEGTDLLFALDSIPAVMGVSSDYFIILTSNVFAILGLRALYFLLAGILHKFRYLKVGLALVLGFIGLKMIGMMFHFHVETWFSLAIVLGVIAVSVIASLVIPEAKPQRGD